MITYAPLVKKPWLGHVAKWKACVDCELCHKRKRVVLARGKVPSMITFIGEAPGGSEDHSGFPFVGEAGRILDQIIEAVEEQAGSFRYSITNIVGCIPLNDADGLSHGNTRQPAEAEAMACSWRLQEFLVEVAKPQGIVLMGNVAKKYFHSFIDVETPAIEVVHPAAMLEGRMDRHKARIAFKKAVVGIAGMIIQLKKGRK